MNKKLMFMLLVLFSASTINAQLEKGDAMFNLGIGMSSYYTSGSGFKATLPPLEASCEYFVGDSFSVGGFLGYYGAKYEQEIKSNAFSVDTKINYSYLSFGALSNYHFVNQETFNVYAGVKLGYVSAKTKITQEISDKTLVDDDILTKAGGKGSEVLFGAHVGALYHISESLALNAELGYGIVLLKIGVSLKL